MKKIIHNTTQRTYSTICGACSNTAAPTNQAACDPQSLGSCAGGGGAECTNVVNGPEATCVATMDDTAGVDLFPNILNYILKYIFNYGPFYFNNLPGKFTSTASLSNSGKSQSCSMSM